MANEPQGAENAPRFFIKGQYIKDLSFENPHAPHSLLSLQEKPQIDLSVTIKSTRLEEQHYEITLHFAMRSTGGDKTLFLMELDYAALVQCVNIPDDKIEMILFIDCAFAVFPFARRVVSDVTRDGGFPALMLEPIDFHALYMHNKQQRDQK
jgi:preprotein translocase subunit SecB